MCVAGDHWPQWGPRWWWELSRDSKATLPGLYKLLLHLPVESLHAVGPRAETQVWQRTEDELELVWIFLRQSSSFAGRSSYPVPPGSWKGSWPWWGYHSLVREDEESLRKGERRGEVREELEVRRPGSHVTDDILGVGAMQWVCKPSNSWSASAGGPKWLTSGGRGRPGGQTSAEETAGWSASVSALLLLPETPTRNAAWTAACNCNRSLSFIFRHSLLEITLELFLEFPDILIEERQVMTGENISHLSPSPPPSTSLISSVWWRMKGEKVRMKIFPTTVLLSELRPRYIPLPPGAPAVFSHSPHGVPPKSNISST